MSRLSTLVAIIVYVSHCFACLWFFAGSGDRYGWATDPDRCFHACAEWDYKNDQIGRPIDVTEEADVPSPLALTGNETGSESLGSYPSHSQYLHSLYYAVTTLSTVGYGDVTPETNGEKSVAIVTELAGGMIFGILAGTLSSMLMTSKMSEARVEEEMEELREFLLSKKVSKPLRRELITQMENYYKKRSAFDENTVLSRLPPKHRKHLLLQLYRTQVVTCPLFGSDLDERIIARLCAKLQPYLAAKGDTIIQEGEHGSEMYMIFSGTMILHSISLPKMDKKTWVDGAFFGELPMLQLGAGNYRDRHLYTVSATSDSDLTFLHQIDFDHLARDYPAFKVQVQQMAAKRAARFGHEADVNTTLVSPSPRVAARSSTQGLIAPSRFIAGDPGLTKDEAVAVGLAAAAAPPSKKDGGLPCGMRTAVSADDRFDHLEMQLDKLQSMVESLIDERAGIKAMLH